MKKVVALAASILLIAPSAFAGSQSVEREVRSPTGKLLYKTKTSGTTTEVRSSTGKLLMKAKTVKDTTEVRSPTGKLLQTVKTK
jgi:hypothetical protein